MNVARIIQVVILVWLLSEIFLVVRSRNNHRAIPRDRGSRTVLWSVIAAGLAAGTACQAFLTSAQIRFPAPWWQGISLALLLNGLAIRWAAIISLGRFFNTSVSIQPDHRLVRTGLFRWVRHPSYSGLVLLYFGMGLSFGNWLSLVVITVSFFAALQYRIRVEEASLVETFGQDYVEYCRSTKRLIPGIY